MILRRFSQNLKAQNWTAIWIEFILLVAGVFLGIQVSNWNADRELDKKSAEFTERLKADLRLEAWSYARLMAYYPVVLSEAERAVSALEGKSELPDEELLISAYRATQYVSHHRSAATYEELTSTGSMGLIRDARLRNTAVRIYLTSMFATVEREGVESAYRLRFRMSVPNDVQDALGRNCGDRQLEYGDFKGLRDVQGYPCTTGLAPEVIAAAAAAIRSDETLLRYLRLRISDIKTRINNFESVNVDILNGLRDIFEEMP